ncbi:hypothetical protein RIF29_24180 [Crotalaria pallida]|uniref:Uncharacterized protein n=1 Tax=Crotalaria pallida TaxID=3830 RepID=A0AAN9EJB2_CROPI
MLGLNVCNKQPLTVKKDKAPKSGSRKSAPIPNVQEMVKKDPFLVPPEYIRDKPIHAGTEKCLSHLSHEIPVIDLSMLRKGCKKELRKLDMACKKWGYFQMLPR